jgi:hypothetical protein
MASPTLVNQAMGKGYLDEKTRKKNLNERILK